MNIIKKLISLVKGSFREMGENVVDANSTTIFAQEIEDAKTKIKAARKDLTEIMAKEMQAERKIAELAQKLDERKLQITAALEKGEDSLAEEVAQAASVIDSELAETQKAKNTYTQHIAKLKSMIEKGNADIEEFERQVSLVKTTENVQKATKAIATNYQSADGTLFDAKETLERIKQKQQDFDDEYLASQRLDEEMSDKGLDERLAEKGISDAKGGNKFLEDAKKEIASRS
ncbi:PspA/IM30 family protein [Kangiella spongicola]|uniref:Phage shock protein A n=1 Tax=Kangiella spongicola TaxID=796379 RepID=A0A318D349_9GAMM|nr:PspA/IM30 family protein [Kangiella spongicola]PXF63610.1 phage shock protein A [Kangiella spongicola]